MVRKMKVIKMRRRKNWTGIMSGQKELKQLMRKKKESKS
jgi:hypothetical protein